MANLQEQKKVLLPFLQRASEVAKADPKIAYYCRLYAMSQAVEMGVGNLHPDIKGLLTALMGSLEHDKQTLELGPGDATHCEHFALSMFGRADRADRAGLSDRNTAITYYAASIFIEILNQFGPLPSETAMKQRFAAWRAAEIRKALSEGRVPDPPPSSQMPPVSEEDELLMDELAKAPSVPGPGNTNDTLGPGPEVMATSTAPVTEEAVSGGDAPEDFGTTTSYPTLDAASNSARASTPASFASGAEAKIECEGGEEELRLPSPPLSPTVGLNLGAAPLKVVWTPPPPRVFHTFQKVLYWPEGAPGPLKGTVAKVTPPTTPDTAATYFVALSGSIEACQAEALMPDIRSGEDVLLHAPDGTTKDATIAEVDASQWPPSYLVRAADGTYTSTTIDRIEALGTAVPPQLPRSASDGSATGSDGAALTGAAVSSSSTPPGSDVSGAPPGSGGELGERGFGSPLVQPPGQGDLPGSQSGPSMPGRGAASAAGDGGGAPSAPLQAPRPPSPERRLPSPERRLPTPASPVPVSGFEPSLAAITEAQKLAKTASSALSFEDVRTAVKYLNDALRLLTMPRP